MNANPANPIQKLTKILEKLKPYGIWYKKNPILTFQSVYETSFQADNEITEYPIEGLNGYQKLTDYKYNTPSMFSMTAVIGRSDNLVEKGWDWVNNNVLGGMDEVSLAQEKLDILMNGIYKLDIKTKNGFYTKYTLKSYNVVENMDNLSMFEINMTFKQVIDRNDWNDLDMRNLEFMDTKYGGNVVTKIIKAVL